VELLLRDLPERRKLVDARVVDKDVQAAEGFLGLGEEALHIGCLGHIPLHRDRFAALSHDLGNHTVGALFAGGVIHHDGRSLRGQALRNTLANSLGCAGDDRDFIVQLTHCSLPMMVVYFDNCLNDAERRRDDSASPVK